MTILPKQKNWVAYCVQILNLNIEIILLKYKDEKLSNTFDVKAKNVSRSANIQLCFRLTNIYSGNQ